MNEIFKKIINSHKNDVRTVIKNITGSQNDDLEQEVYIKAWKNIDDYKHKGKFKQWICTISANISRDYLKSKTYKQTKFHDNSEDAVLNISDNTPPDARIYSIERQKTIWKAINELPKKNKEVIILFDMEEMTYEEISKKINCPVGTVKSRLYNARKKLAESLKDLIQ